MKFIINDGIRDNYLFININDSGITYSGFYLEDRKIKNIDKNIINVFNMLRLSNNNTKLDNEGELEVYLDNDTNFKHYFYKGKEDYGLFYLRNATFLEYPSLNDKLKKIIKLTVQGLSIIIVDGFVISILVTNIPDLIVNYENKQLVKHVEYIDELKDEAIIEELSFDDIKELIYSSKLTDKEKEYIFNEQLINDVLPYINGTDMDFYLAYRLKDFYITDKYSFKEKKENRAQGYYSYDNCIHIKKYDEKNFDEYKETIAHEMCHVFQRGYRNMIIEAQAEIMSHEYYNTPINTYANEVTDLRLLMEIIGPQPIMRFSMSNDYTEINELLSEYLNEEELKQVYDTIMLYNDDDQGKLLKLKELLLSVYNKKYGDDSIELALYDRYYFNSNLNCKDTEVFGYEDILKGNIYDLYNDGKIKFYEELSANEIFTLDGFNKYIDDYNEDETTYFLGNYPEAFVIDKKIEKSNNCYTGSITYVIDDEVKTITLEEAFSDYGLIIFANKKVYVSVDEYISNSKDRDIKIKSDNPKEKFKYSNGDIYLVVEKTITKESIASLFLENNDLKNSIN